MTRPHPPRAPATIITMTMALMLAAASCAPAEGPSSGLRIRASPTPPTVGDNRIIVQVPPGTGDVTSVTVTGRPLEGPPGPPPMPAADSGPGAHAVAAFPFDRSGDWRLVAEVTLASGAVLRDSVDMQVVGGG